MPRARVVSAERAEDLVLGFRRLGLEEEASVRKGLHLRLLLTGLSAEEQAFLHRPEGLPLALAFHAGRPEVALLGGSHAAFNRLMLACKSDASLSSLAQALEDAKRSLKSPPPLVLGGRSFAFGQKTYVMGIVNVTPDSFSDGGRFLSPEAAVQQGLALVSAGADLLDIGGASTRPGAPPLPAEEELRRVLPVLQRLKAQTDVPLSIDTYQAEVARQALKAGASLVNDISGFHFDPKLAEVTAEAQAACCLMHIQGRPDTMQKNPQYEDVVDEVLRYLEEGVALALKAGIPRERIVVDPGIGFGKTLSHNLFLLRRLPELRALNLPLLVGTSRKSFLGALTGQKPPEERLWATLGSVAALAAQGHADFLRVHDVEQVRDAVLVADAMRQAEEGGSLYAPLAARGLGA